MNLKIITSEVVVEINKLVCADGDNRHQCYDVGKVDSALHTSFYPGYSPFVHGGIAKIAGALAYYLTMAHAFYDGNKRTAAIASITLLELNDLELKYADESNGKTALANIFEACASGTATKEQMIEWFDQHKTKASL